ncbi:MAG: c-type cytochrome [Burkholderiales bacterium]
MTQAPNSGPGERAGRRGIIFCVFALAAFPIGAQTLEERLEKVLADPAARDSAAAAAKNLVSFCANCHGGDGNSALGEVPNLAGQHPVYLLAQIEKFTKGQRRNRFKEGVMKLLSENDRINASVYYSGQIVRPAGAGRSAHGQGLYKRRCVVCHGAQGRGTQATPRLAGQQVDYLIQSLSRYRDRTGERIYLPMAAGTAGLKDPDIKALAVFLSSLP